MAEEAEPSQLSPIKCHLPRPMPGNEVPAWRHLPRPPMGRHDLAAASCPETRCISQAQKSM